MNKRLSQPSRRTQGRLMEQFVAGHDGSGSRPARRRRAPEHGGRLLVGELALFERGDGSGNLFRRRMCMT